MGVRVLWRPLVSILVLIAAGTAVRLLPGGVHAVLSRAGGEGRAPFIAGAAVLCAAGMPRQVAAYAGAYAFGLWQGAALALLAQVIGCVIDVGWARLLGGSWAQEFVQRRIGGRLSLVGSFVAANPFAATLMLRLLPIGNNLVLNLLAGVSGIAIAPFLAASAVGYVPQTIIFALLGAGTRIDEASQLALGIALFLASAALGFLLLRRFRGTVGA